jgi:predicted nucleotidyltransferase
MTSSAGLILGCFGFNVFLGMGPKSLACRPSVWQELSEYDLETAKNLIQGKRYLYIWLKITEVVRAYVREVEKSYRVEQVILFGSYATGSAHEYSDINLAIVSPGKPEMEVLEHLSRIAMNVDTALNMGFH